MMFINLFTIFLSVYVTASSAASFSPELLNKLAKHAEVYVIVNDEQASQSSGEVNTNTHQSIQEFFKSINNVNRNNAVVHQVGEPKQPPVNKEQLRLLVARCQFLKRCKKSCKLSRSQDDCNSQCGNNIDPQGSCAGATESNDGCDDVGEFKDLCAQTE